MSSDANVSKGDTFVTHGVARIMVNGRCFLLFLFFFVLIPRSTANGAILPISPHFNNFLLQIFGLLKVHRTLLGQ
jgi:hypothetical protein